MKKNNLLKGFLLGAGLLLLGGLSAPMTVEAAGSPEQIINGVYAGDINLSGMTEEEARAAVESYVASLKETNLVLTAVESSIEVTAGELGLNWNNTELTEAAVRLGKSGNIVERYKARKDAEYESVVYDLQLSGDLAAIEGILDANQDQFNIEAVNAGLTRENGVFNIAPGSSGVALNVSESAAVIQNYLTTSFQQGAEGTIQLVADITEPMGTEAELAKVKDILGSAYTSYALGSGRSENVANGARKINGSVIYPGEEFSVYEYVHPFTAENGYYLAGSYENGSVVDTYGGGICQVSTTLYNAVLKAELEVVERFSHSMIVSYVDPSKDAAIAGTYKDFVFKNSTNAPIYIEGVTSGGKITFTIYGEESRSADRTVSYVSEVTGTTEAGTKYTVGSGEFGVKVTKQSAHTGYTAVLWKVVTENGQETKTKVNSSTYRASDAIVEIGISSPNSEATAELKSAIESNDEAKIAAAIEKWKDNLVEPEPEEEDGKQDEEKPSKPDNNNQDKPNSGDEEKPEAQPEDETVISEE